MAKWYALICLKDQYMPNGKLDYRTGDVKSFGTVLSEGGDKDKLAAKGIEAVEIGEYGESGPDFNVERFDVEKKKMVPYTPPKDEVDSLLDKASWNTKDQEDAMRMLLKQLKGK
jgi:hypothetical protein